jgi:2-oxo-4-hydroxy-4-carboxy--5-ureidoimidazoline (OHCU) decarboxylase
MQLDKQRKLRILMMSLAYMYKFGEPFVDLVKDGTPEENRQAWGTLREQIKEVHTELKRKLSQS